MIPDGSAHLSPKLGPLLGLPRCVQPSLQITSKKISVKVRLNTVLQVYLPEQRHTCLCCSQSQSRGAAAAPNAHHCSSQGSFGRVRTKQESSHRVLCSIIKTGWKTAVCHQAGCAASHMQHPSPELLLCFPQALLHLAPFLFHLQECHHMPARNFLALEL